MERGRNHIRQTESSAGFFSDLLDRPAHATLILDRLATAYGPDKIFMDVNDLLPGEHFAEELEKELAKCDVLLAVIGPAWLELLEARSASGERDYVREEIASALKRRIIVVPVLVDRAELPPADRLPEDLKQLVLRQKHGLTHERVDRDVGDLIAAINAVRDKKRPAPPASSPPALPMVAVVVALASILLGILADWQSQLIMGFQVEAKQLAISSVTELTHIILVLLLQGVAAYIVFGRRRQLQGSTYALRFARASLFLMPIYLVTKLAAIAADMWFAHAMLPGLARGGACAANTNSLACLQEAQAGSPAFTALQLVILIAGTLWVNARLAGSLRDMLQVSWSALFICNLCISLFYLATIQLVRP